MRKAMLWVTTTGFMMSLLFLSTGCREDGIYDTDGGEPDTFPGGTDSQSSIDDSDNGRPTEPFEGTHSGLVFDPPRGIYDAPVNLTISHPSRSEIRYTLDGSDPRTSAEALTAPLPLSLTVDPTDTTHRYTAPGVVIRATADGTSAEPGAVATHTYLFLDQVIDLSPDGEAPGPMWPSPNDDETDWWEDGGGQVMNYGLDPDVFEAPAYAGQMATALSSIPSISLVTDLPNLFDQRDGIYMNASERGELWERFCSVELLNPDDSPGFQANAGVRIRGGYSRRSTNPKHAFRLFFRSDYGTPKLIFPLFGSEGAGEFDKIDLRTSQNYSWSSGDGDSQENTMNRDVFSRDLQRELGHPYTRSRYYHLYIDGVYWGLFQSQERSEARFAADYFGGDREDYDTVKVDTEAGYTLEVSDGTIDAWSDVWTLAQSGFDADANYFALEGKGPDGVRDRNLPVLVDVDNLIDYMLVTFYTGNYDGPVSKFLENQNPNNFYAIYSRADTNQGFRFFAHDNEHSLMYEPVSITTGVDENRVNIGDENSAVDDSGRINDRYRMSVTSLERFHPQWLHHRLTANAGYRQRFAARAQTRLEGNGPMTPAHLSALFQSRADEIDTAIIAESARWGDVYRDTPRTRNDDWQPAIDRVIDGFIAERTDILIDQLRTAGLY